MSCHNNCGCSPSGYPTANNECCTDVAEYTRFAYSSAQSAYANAQNAEQSANDAAATLAGAVQKSGDTMTGLLILSGNPSASLGAATKQYVDVSLSNKVDRTGDTMIGQLALSGPPVSSLDATSKDYVDTATGLKVAKAGDSMSGSLGFIGTTSSFGYFAGSGGTVVQTALAASVTLNRPSGQITTFAFTTATQVEYTFTLINSLIQDTDILLLSHVAGSNFGAYLLQSRCNNGNASISIRNMTTGTLSSVTATINFALIKSTTV